MKKRVLSLLLVLVMALALVSVATAAELTPYGAYQALSNYIKVHPAKKGANDFFLDLDKDGIPELVRLSGVSMDTSITVYYITDQGQVEANDTPSQSMETAYGNAGSSETYLIYFPENGTYGFYRVDKLYRSSGGETFVFQYSGKGKFTVSRNYRGSYQKKFLCKIGEALPGLNDYFAAPAPTTTQVAFETGGGTPIAPVEEKLGQPLVMPETPTRRGYAFGGWYVDKWFIAPWDGTQTAYPGMVIYAKWDPYAKPSTQTVTVDGTAVEFPAYALQDANGNDTNYVKLRDLAYVLQGTSAQFSVDWANGMVSLGTGETYVPNGGEMQDTFEGRPWPYADVADATTVDGAVQSLSAIRLTDPLGGGHTYYKLRDLGDALGFTVGWTEADGITIATGSTQPLSYTKPEAQPAPKQPGTVYELDNGVKVCLDLTATVLENCTIRDNGSGVDFIHTAAQQAGYGGYVGGLYFFTPDYDGWEQKTPVRAVNGGHLYHTYPSDVQFGPGQDEMYQTLNRDVGYILEHMYVYP